MVERAPDPSTLAPRTRKVRRLTKALIAEAVLDVGFKDLTITAVARQLGVAHASLYRHIASRDELVALGSDLLIDRGEWPASTTNWRDLLEGHAWMLWDLLERYPGLAHETVVLESQPSAVRRLAVSVRRSLMAAGFADEDAALAADTVFDLTFDVYARTEVIESLWSPSVTGRYWFGRKLTVVLDGLGHLAQPIPPPEC